MASEGADADGVKAFFWTLDAAMHLALWLLAITLLAMVVDLVAAHFWWHADPIGHIEALLHGYTEQAADLPLARRAADAAYALWFGWTGIDASLRAHQAESAASPLWQPLLTGELRLDLTVAMLGMKLFGIRAALLVAMLPQFALAAGVALVDGSAARSIRRACGGHESATRHHRAVRLLKGGLMPLAVLVWLVAPIMLSAAWFQWLTSLALALLLWTAAQTYKKYG